MPKYMISISDEQDLYKLDEEYLHNVCGKMFDYIMNNESLLEISPIKTYLKENNLLFANLLICDNEYIRKINKKYRKKDKPTDVITFALFSDSEEKMVITNQIHLGEILISAQRAAEQAPERDKSFEDEFLFLLTHGILHLLGFEHNDDESLNFMLNTQEKMIANVKI